MSPLELEPVVQEASRHYNLPPQLIKAVIRVESNFVPSATSPKGAQGLMQLMPGTAEDLQVRNAYDIRENVLGGARYLRILLEKFGYRLPLALAAYNAGPQRVEQYQDIPPIKETRNYLPMDEPVNSTNPEGEVSLLDYLIILAKHSRLIIIASAAVTVLTYLYLFCTPNTYKATARLLPPQQNLTMSAQILDTLGSRVSPGGGLASSLLGLKSPGELYVAMMTSNTVLDHLVERFNLMELKTKSLEDARKALSSRVKINAGNKDTIIVINVTYTNPKLAAELANAFIEELDRLLQGLALQEAKGRLAFLEKERFQASQNLTKAEESLRLFSEKNSVLQIDTQTKGAIEYISRLRAEIDAKEVTIEVLRQQATPFNYDVVRMETEIKGLKEKLRNAEAQWENCVSNVCLPTNKAPGLGLEYLRLLRETKFQESLYQLFTKMVEIARLDMVRDVAVVQVLDPAMPPEKRSNKRIFPSMLAGIITFCMMIFVAFGLEFMRKVDLSEDDIRRLGVLKDYLRVWTDMLIRMKYILRLKRKL
ncbi:MAG: transglycosylase SLT domain-containing protein [Deltaproteobacteria bacterium]|nr:transglycosylase SLT domain-containing protein [Deltaproteobacteria bacterium]